MKGSMITHVHDSLESALSQSKTLSVFVKHQVKTTRSLCQGALVHEEFMHCTHASH